MVEASFCGPPQHNISTSYDKRIKQRRAVVHLWQAVVLKRTYIHNQTLPASRTLYLTTYVMRSTGKSESYGKLRVYTQFCVLLYSKILVQRRSATFCQPSSRNGHVSLYVDRDLCDTFATTMRVGLLRSCMPPVRKNRGQSS